METQQIIINPMVVEALMSAPDAKRARLCEAVIMYSSGAHFEPDNDISYEFGFVRSIMDQQRRISSMKRAAAHARWGNLHMQSKCSANAVHMQSTCSAYAKQPETEKKIGENQNISTVEAPEVSIFKEIVEKTCPVEVDLTIHAKEERTKEETLTKSYQKTKKEPPKGGKKESKDPEVQESEQMTKFKIWLSDNCPYIYDHLRLPTEAELQKLINKSGGAKGLANICEAIENRKDLRKRYVTLYRTALNWADKESKS